jgi:hypothetical protein
MGKDELKRLYPVGTEFTDRFGQKCIVRGYRTNRRLGVQLIVDATHTWEDGHQETHKQAYYPSELPAKS